MRSPSIFRPVFRPVSNPVFRLVSNPVRGAVALLLVLLLALAGCRAPFGLVRVAGDVAPATGTTLAKHRPATLLVRVHWPERDLPGFRAAAIPLSTNTLIVKVTGAGRDPVTKVINRPEGDQATVVNGTLNVPEGNGLTVAVAAYRETTVTEASTPIAAGTAAGINAAAGALVPVSIVLTAAFAPTISGMSFSGSPTGQEVVISGTNFGSGAVPIEVAFNDVKATSVTRVGDTVLEVTVPALATTGPLVVTADGIPSAPNTFYWVMRDDPTLTLSFDGNYNSLILRVGQTVDLTVEENVSYLFASGKTEADFPDYTGKPVRSLTIDDPAVATVAGLELSAMVAGSTTIRARLGSASSNALAVTVSSPWTIATIAGRGADSGTGGEALTASLDQPVGLAAAIYGVLVTEQGAHRIRLLASGTMTGVAGSGAVGAADGASDSATFFAPAGVAMDASGAIYVADQSNHAIRKVSGGQVSTLTGSGQAGFSGDGGDPLIGKLNFPQGVAVNASGDVIVADTFNHRIRVIAGEDGIGRYGQTMVKGMLYTLAGKGPDDEGIPGFSDGTRRDARFDTPTGVAVGPDGTIYVADSGNNRVRKIDAAGDVTTIAGTGDQGFAGDGGPAAAAALDRPVALALGPDGNVYVTDKGNKRVRAFQPGGNISTVAGNGSGASTGDGGPAIAAGLATPAGIAVASGSLYIAETGSHRLRRVTLADGTIATVAGLSGASGIPASSAPLAGVSGAAVDGSVYIVDTDRNLIRRIESDGTVSTVAGTGTAGSGGDGGDPAAADLNRPTSARFDAEGNLYIVDRGNLRVRVIAKTSGTLFGAAVEAGKIHTVVGGGSVYTEGGSAASAVLTDPVGLAFLPSGDLLVSDSGANAVRRIARGTGAITTFAGNGQEGYGGDGSAATSAQLSAPRGLAVDASGSVYIADGLNHAVRKISSGAIMTVAGNGDANYLGDNGDAKSAQLSSPWDVVVDGAGGFFVSDSGNHVIRWVAASGTIVTIAGTPKAEGFAGDGGPALTAKLFSPRGMARDASRNLYVADSGNHRIRKLSGGLP